MTPNQEARKLQLGEDSLCGILSMDYTAHAPMQILQAVKPWPPRPIGPINAPRRFVPGFQPLHVTHCEGLK